MRIAIGDRFVGQIGAGPFAGKVVEVVSTTARNLRFQELRAESPVNAMMIWKSSRKRFEEEFEREVTR